MPGSAAVAIPSRPKASSSPPGRPPAAAIACSTANWHRCVIAPARSPSAPNSIIANAASSTWPRKSIRARSTCWIGSTDVARARNIKPGFFTNDELVELPFATRLLFIGLWTIADREGRIVDRPKKIKMEIFPADDVDCDQALCDLAAAGFIHRYQADNVKVIEIANFAKHQAPHSTEKDSALPDVDGFYTVNERSKNGGVTGKFTKAK